MLPLSFAQQRLWFLAQLDGASDTYHIPLAIRLQGSLDRSALAHALDALVTRHEALRTVFVAVNGQPQVKILQPQASILRTADLRGSSYQDELLKSSVHNEISEPFELTEGPLIRALLIELQDDEWVLLITQHHIVSDGWSSGIMLQELSQLYTAYCNGEASPLAPLRIQYPDYAAWQREWLSGDRLRIQSDYWRTALAGSPVLLDLPTDRPRPPQQSFKGDHVPIELDPQITNALKQLSQQHGVTLFMTILSAWSAVLSRLSGQDDIVIGTPSANRSHPDIEPLIGFFVNTLALRVDLSGEPTTRDLLDRVRRGTLAAFSHQDLPFEQVVEIVQPPRKMDHTPLFQVMFVWQNNEAGELDLQGLQVTPHEIDHNSTKFDLSLALWESDDTICGGLSYATSLFDRTTIERHVGYLHTMLVAMTTAAERAIADVDILSPVERTLVLEAWNSTTEEYASDVCLHQLFEQQVERTPDAVAVVHEDQSLTYGELNARANCLAHHLIQLGIKPDDLVAICVERSPAMLVGILAVLKAGGAYVPLDPFYASDRLRDIISDAAPTILIADRIGTTVLDDSVLASLTVVDPMSHGHMDATNPVISALTSYSLAYVIYTSGSTGKPKGVMLEHQGAVNLVYDRPALFDIHLHSRVLQYTSLSFDHSVSEIFSALHGGASLYMLSNEIRLDRVRLWDYLARHSITHVSFTPTLLHDCKDMTPLESLRCLVVMGETMPPSLPALMRMVAPSSLIINEYGPTECSVATTVWKCVPDFSGDKVPIGRPLPNKTIYLLDSHGNPVPPGSVGEMYIGGVGVARGYLNRPDLTLERFLPDPFSRETGARMYRTGDLAKHLPDGNIVCLGRNDHQVKIRGFRIELGEIETRLSEHPMVSEAVVVAVGEASSKRLIAYVITQEHGQYEESTNARLSSMADGLALALRNHLATCLPEYMIPSAFVRMEALPMTPNGKLDQRALPSPGAADFAHQLYEAPQGKLETTLAAMWMELLHLERVSRNDSFFALGGHSLLAVRLMNRVSSLGASVPLSFLFDAPTLKAFACIVADHILQEQAVVLAPQAESRDGPLLLSFDQQRLWFLSQMDGVDETYHTPRAMRLRGALNISALRQALDELYSRHEALRSIFVNVNGQPQVQVLSPTGMPWRLIDLQNDSEQDAKLKRAMDNEARAPFDLARGPAIRTTIIQLQDEDHVLLINQHHIVSDGWSFGIMLSELNALYMSFKNCQPSPLPPLKIQYPDYAAWQRGWLSGDRLRRQSDYWRTALAGSPVLLDLPTDRPRPPQQSFKGDHVPIELDPQVTKALKQLSQQHGVTLFMTILSAWSILLSRLSGQEDVVIGIPSANRIRPEFEPLIGFFVNTLALRIDLSDEPSTQELLDRVRQVTVSAYAHQDLPFEQVVEVVQPPRERIHAPIFQVMFAWENNESGEWDLPGLKVEPYELDDSTAKFDLTLALRESGDSIVGAVEYATALFDPETITRHIGYLPAILLAMTADVAWPVAAINILQSDERALLLDTWNQTTMKYTDNLHLHRRFEQQVELAPDAIAVVHEEHSLTYSELNARANNLAHHLIHLGVQPDTIVGICVERSPALIIGILAILKSGGAYVPLDPAHASERLLDILSDAAPSVLVVDTYGMKVLQGADMSQLKVVDPNSPLATSTDNPHIPSLSMGHLAHVIYTSGSTGKPKGVMVEHCHVARLFASSGSWFDFSGRDTWCLLHSFAFDFSIWEIWGALRHGGKLVIVSQDVVRTPQDLYRLVHDQNVTVLNMTPSAFKPLIEIDAVEALPSSLRYVILAGETLVPAMLKPWFSRHAQDSPKIGNIYGPTEITIYATSRLMTLEDCSKTESPIGTRLPDLRTYVLDKFGQPVPRGVVGELYVGGAGVSRGYLNRPDLTAERFLADPFVEGHKERMYKTGDLVKYLSDGSLVYMGRNDHQVKIRGFRIELGEIETRLTEHPLISEAVVVALGEESDKKLVAYVSVRHDGQLSENGAEPSCLKFFASTLRSHLLARLPEYMVPSAFVHMDTFPLTTNGKLDLRALPAPTDADFARQTYEAPQGEIECALASIWSELLQVEQVSRHDSFFALGGHSLLAARLINRVSTLGADVTLSSLFASPSLHSFASVIEEKLRKQTTVFQPITPVSREAELPLSYAQQRLWFLAQLDGVSDIYHIVLAVQLRGQLKLSCLEFALDKLCARHEALRSVFISVRGQPQVKILSSKVALRIVDLRDAIDRRAQLELWTQKETSEPFDLAKGPLIRALLIQLEDDDSVLLITQHHIISDGWSSGIMLRELSQLYTAYCNEEPSPLTPLRIQYPDYAAWQREWLSGDRLRIQSDYWRTALAGSPVLLDLPTDRPRPPQQSFKGDHVPIELDPQITNALKQLSQQHGVTLFMTILSAWSAVLSRLSGQDDIVIGTPSANRSHPDIEPLIGFFVNTLALRVDLSGEPTTRDLLDRVRRGTLAAFSHQDLPFEQVVEIVQPPRKMDHTPLFQVMFVWQNNEAGELDLPGLQVTPHEIDHNSAKFDLSLALWESDDTICGGLSYATSLFDRTTIERHVGYLHTMLVAMTTAAERAIADVDILSPVERTLVLEAWNSTTEEYASDVCLHQLFEQQVERTPDAVAVVHEDQSLTYGELNARANCLAHHLIQLGIKPDDLVAICVERSPAMLVGILAVLKAGGAYVPLDPFYASDRLRDIISDAAPTILIADRIGTTVLDDSVLALLTVVDPMSHGHMDATNPVISALTSRSLAYVIYTSGSTGKPKGVMLEHPGAVNLVYDRPALFDIHLHSRVLQYTSLSFDHSVSEIFSALHGGASLYMLSNEIRLDRVRLWDYLARHSITHVSFTPTLLHDCKDMTPLESLRCLVVMGETMPPSLPALMRMVAPNSLIINEYGPTECSVATTVWKCVPDFSGDKVPIGRPLPNKTIYLLDTHGNPVPPGSVGEMYIGGVGVARGYLNRPDLTLERFLPDPFSREIGARMYRTGDLAKHLPDGNIVCLGRNDHQVKIRGFRIELGEIETRLSEHPMVSEAVVVAVGEASSKRLIAYVITQEHGQYEESTNARLPSMADGLALALRNHLATCLPEYMIPSAFVRMEALPMTPNGKLDQRALPSPGADDFAHQLYEAPQGKLETTLAAMWMELLHLERVSRNDSFFALGGHSLLAVRLMNRVSSLGASVPLTKLFESPSLSAFTAVVREQLEQGECATPTIVPASRCDPLALSFSQQRMWFLSQLEGVADTYHSPKAIRLHGILDMHALRQALDELYTRHEALRSVFLNVNGQPQVQILPAHGMPWSAINLEGIPAQDAKLRDAVEKEVRKAFDLSQGPLIRATLIQLGGDEYTLVITQHHIVSDGWSFGLMLDELSQLYTAYMQGEPNPLPPLKIQYPDYAAWQREWFSGDRLKMQSEFWRTALSGAPVLLDLPTDRPRPPQQSFSGDHVSIEFNSQITNALKLLSQKHGVTLFMTILSAWSTVLSRLSGQDDIVIGIPSANRSCPDTEPLIGFFVNTLALRIDLSSEPTARTLLERVRSSTLAAFAHQDLPFEQVVEIVQPPRTMDHTPLFQVMLVWQNKEDGDLELPGLQVSPYEFDYDAAKFDLTLALSESDNGIIGSLGYATSLFDRATVERHVGYLQTVLLEMTADAEQPVSTIDILPAAERKLLLETWNHTDMEYADQQCLHHLFEQQVERTPDAIALVCGNEALTYGELNARSNSLAHQLIGLGVQPDTLVAICVERSSAMIIGILAILKAGGAYVPLDPFYASDRLHAILQDAAPLCLVADKHGMSILDGTVLPPAMAIVYPNNTTTAYPASNLEISAVTSRHLAYVFYTSGTTGKPKGVMVEHQGLVSLVTTQQRLLNIQPSSRMTQFASVGFDTSVWEIFAALFFGGALHVLQQDVRLDTRQLWAYLEGHQVTHAIFTPSALQDCEGLPVLNSMSMVLLGGEALSDGLVRKVSKLMPAATIVNEYGPTEASVASLSWTYTEPDFSGQDMIPIGRPHANKRVYLLDSFGMPVPLGAVGEIYLGGVGVARGYLNRPDLTNEKFLRDPFSEKTDARMYKTGDLGKYLANGNILCLGRTDFQVKIRGFRIELGEIEARLAEHSIVSEAVVVAAGAEANKHLVAYVVLSHDQHFKKDEDASEPLGLRQVASTLRSYLSGLLPDYMVPAAFVQLSAFPLTPNDKLDRNALPAPNNEDFASEAYEEPKGEIENLLSSIWAELLNIKRVGRNDGFFALGGHSLLAVRMISRIRAMLGFEITLRTLFEAPTIAQLAPRLLATGAAHDESYDVLLPIKPQGTRPPLFCVHPGTGLSWCYTGLSTQLDPDQPLYGLQARGFIDNGNMASTLDEMVLDYIDQVRSVQPHGPYHLLGYSFGGLVAHTMASYLEKQGERVALVALMDTRTNYHTMVQEAEEDEDESSQQQGLIQMFIGDTDQYSPDMMNPILKRASIVGDNNGRIGRQQGPQVTSGDLVLFRATVLEADGRTLLNADDWKSHARGAIEVYDIECAHDYMDLPEPTAIIGRVLSRKLDECYRSREKEE
ncbi:unnamed protein product [Mortierella alpina]